MAKLPWHMWARLLTLTAAGCELNLGMQSSVARAMQWRIARRQSVTRLGADIGSCAADLAWAALWAILYRKFFWDFVGAQLGPKGLM